MFSFFQRCLHDWQPHDGEPVSALFFCDNHLAQDENSSSWRFLITGAKYNSEIKVWCSVTWKCLQVLRLILALILDAFTPSSATLPIGFHKNILHLQGVALFKVNIELWEFLFEKNEKVIGILESTENLSNFFIISSTF